MAKLELGLEFRSVFLQDPGLPRRHCAPLTSEQLVYESQAKRGVQSPTSYQPKDCQFVLSKFSPRPVSSTKAKPLPLIPAGLIVTTDGYLALRLRCSDLHRDLESPEWTVNPSRASPAQPHSLESHASHGPRLSLDVTASMREVNWPLLCNPNKPRGRGAEEEGDGGFNLFASQCSHEFWAPNPGGGPHGKAREFTRCKNKTGVHALPCRLK